MLLATESSLWPLEVISDTCYHICELEGIIFVYYINHNRRNTAGYGEIYPKSQLLGEAGIGGSIDLRISQTLSQKIKAT